MTRSGHIPSLDGLRAVSILVVFAAHVGFGHVVPGGVGVTVFFFLSGYLITTLLLREWDAHGAISQTAFYMRRLVRLGPPILVTLALALLLLRLGAAEGTWSAETVLSQVFFFYNYHSLHDADFGTVDGLGVLWSLSVEEHFYLLWPTLFVVLTVMRAEVRITVLLLVGILLWRTWRAYMLQSSDWAIYISSDTRLDSLLYGCLLAVLAAKGHAATLFPDRASLRIPILAAAVAILLASLLFRDEMFRTTLRYSVQGLALMPIFHYAVTRPGDVAFRALNLAPVRRVGQWSFSIYLGHHVIIQALVHAGVGEPGDPALVVAAAVASLAYGAAMHAMVEAPFHRLRRSLTGHGAPRLA